MTRKLNLTVAGPLERLADLTPGATTSALIRLIRRSAQVIAEAEPELSDAERELVEPILTELLLLDGDRLPSGARLAMEVGDLLAAQATHPPGVAPDITNRICRWPLTAIWALAEGLSGDVLAMSARTP
jgi:hypothetical protein